VCCSVAHNVDGSKRPLVCVVGAEDFVTESVTSTGQWQLTCYYVNSDYSSVVQSVTLEHDSVRPTYLQAVDGEDCVCGITTKQVTIWYRSVVILAAFYVLHMHYYYYYYYY